MFYHGWDDLLRILEDHQKVARKHFPEFYISTEKGAEPPLSALRLPVDRELNILLTDEELALFCSEASWEMRNNPAALLAVEHADEQHAISMIAEIEAVEVLDAGARQSRSAFREYLAWLSPKIRRAEVAVRLYLLMMWCGRLGSSGMLASNSRHNAKAYPGGYCRSEIASGSSTTKNRCSGPP